MPSISDKYSLEENQWRIERLRTWIQHAEKDTIDENKHVGFLFYWIAYEAAYGHEKEGKRSLTEEGKSFTLE